MHEPEKHPADPSYLGNRWVQIVFLLIAVLSGVGLTRTMYPISWNVDDEKFVMSVRLDRPLDEQSPAALYSSHRTAIANIARELGAFKTKPKVCIVDHLPPHVNHGWNEDLRTIYAGRSDGSLSLTKFYLQALIAERYGRTIQPEVAEGVRLLLTECEPGSPIRRFDSLARSQMPPMEFIDAHGKIERDDQWATSCLISVFYEVLIAGKSIGELLDDAQHAEPSGQPFLGRGGCGVLKSPTWVWPRVLYYAKVMEAASAGSFSEAAWKALLAEGPPEKWTLAFPFGERDMKGALAKLEATAVLLSFSQTNRFREQQSLNWAAFRSTALPSPSSTWKQLVESNGNAVLLILGLERLKRMSQTELSAAKEELSRWKIPPKADFAKQQPSAELLRIMSDSGLQLVLSELDRDTSLHAIEHLVQSRLRSRWWHFLPSVAEGKEPALLQQNGVLREDAGEQ